MTRSRQEGHAGGWSFAGEDRDRMVSLAALTGGVTHEVANTLAAVQMCVELLEQRCSRPEDQKLLESLGASARRGIHLVRQMLWIAQGVEEPSTLFQPQHLIADAARTARETFPRSIEVVTDYPSDLWLLEGDPHLFFLALIDLCLLARDHLPDGGTLVLAARNLTCDPVWRQAQPEATATHHVVIEAVVSGWRELAGLREEASRTHSIAAAWGGFLESAHLVDGNRIFRLHLPTLAGSVPPRDETSARLQGNGQLILIAEEQGAFREALAGTLRSHNYRTVAASDGAEAVALFARHASEIAAVLASQDLRFLNARALRRALATLRPEIPVLLLLGVGMRPEEMGSDFSGVLAKPFLGSQLLEALGGLL